MCVCVCVNVCVNVCLYLCMCVCVCVCECVCNLTYVGINRWDGMGWDGWEPLMVNGLCSLCAMIVRSQGGL